jgi:hypothetical protein
MEDSTYFDELYSLKARYDKYEWMAGQFGANTMTFTTAKSDLHAIRRAPLNPIFSKRSIIKFEPVIRDKVELMVKGITEAKNTGDVLVLSDAFNAYAGDAITEYCFRFCYNPLESPGFKDNFHPAFMVVSAIGHLAMQFPLMYPVSRSEKFRRCCSLISDYELFPGFIDREDDARFAYATGPAKSIILRQFVGSNTDEIRICV